jgi:hypothetical protein
MKGDGWMKEMWKKRDRMEKRGRDRKKNVFFLELLFNFFDKTVSRSPPNEALSIWRYVLSFPVRFCNDLKKIFSGP